MGLTDTLPLAIPEGQEPCEPCYIFSLADEEPMTRALATLLTVVTLILGGTVATAYAKPKIAILGLEAVVGANGKIDPADSQFAKTLTNELRLRAQSSKLYDPTNDKRELADEKLMSGCSNEHPSCMAPIGAQMGAEAMLFGNIENAKEKGVDGWKVSLTLISVSKKQQLQNLRKEFIAEKDAKGAALSAWALKQFKSMTGEVGEGQLVIRVVTSGVTSGTVLVNGEMKDTLKSGQATLSLPAGGKYKIGVDVDGYKLWEQENVSIGDDKTVELKPDLVKSGGTGGTDNKTQPNTNPTGPDNGNPDQREGTVSHGGSSKRTVLKITAGVALGGAAVTGALWGYKYFGDIRSFDNATLGNVRFMENGGTVLDPGASVGPSRCGKGTFTGDAGAAKSANDKFSAACDAHDQTKYLIPATIGLAAIGAGALIWVLATSDDDNKEHAMGKQRKRKNLIVTPVVSPDGTGATLRFDW